MHNISKTKRLTLSAMMLAISTVIAFICAQIPFLHLPFGGAFTVGSMLPIVIIAYMYGTRWGLFASFTYSVLQILLDLMAGTGGSTVMALFMPNDENFMGFFAAVCIVLLDYLVAYTVLGLGGLFRNRFSKGTALCLGSIVALSLRYLAHILSGYIFYHSYAEWFFSQENFKIGAWILEHISGAALSWLYSIVYNGLYMLPEIILTAAVALVIARIPQIKKEEVSH